MLTAVLTHPRTQRSLVDAQLARDLSNRTLRLNNHQHRFVAVLLSELTVLRHNDPSSSGEILPSWVTVRWEQHTSVRRSGYFRVSGIGASRSWKARRWVGVGS